MKATSLWLCLYGLCGSLILIVGCTPTETPPVTVTQPIAQVTATNPLTAIHIVTTPPTIETPATTTTPAPTAVTYTSTPDPAQPTWTPQPSPTIISMPTIEPVATLTPRPLWTILFNAVPCPESWTNCSNDLFMHDYSRWYLVNSDGSDLYPLEDSDTFLVNMWGVPYFSPDNRHLAYLARSETDDIPYLALTDISSGNTISLGSVSGILELSFLSELDCVVVYTVPWPQPNELPTITTVNIQKLCPDLSDPEILDRIAFPDLRPGYRHIYRLSPQNDALLAVGRNGDDIFEIYVHEFNSPQPPQLLFSAEDERWWIDTVRWHPDGQHVEFFVQRAYNPDEMIDIILYASDRQATNLQTVLELQLPFSIMRGSWSPDGQQLAFFPGMPDYTPPISGLYMLDLETGMWQQILSELYTSEPLINAWPIDLP